MNAIGDAGKFTMKRWCTHTKSEHNKEDDDLQLLISPFITSSNIAGI